jgi:hypothetical protein
MFELLVPNRVNDPAKGGVICFMASRKLSPEEIKRYLSAYLRNENTFPPSGVEVTTEILVDDSPFFPGGVFTPSVPQHA